MKTKLRRYSESYLNMLHQIFYMLVKSCIEQLTPTNSIQQNN